MSMTQETLEILIGKYLDGEITPSEQQILQKELDSDSHAKELLEQLQALHKRSCEAVASEIVARGNESEAIFEQAWQRQAANPLRRVLKMDGRLRFAAGLAAGLVIGLILQFVVPFISPPQTNNIPPSNMIAQNTDNRMDDVEATYPETLMNSEENVMRNVNWYSFTDQQGNQWLIEGIRENIVTPAVYYEDL